MIVAVSSLTWAEDAASFARMESAPDFARLVDQHYAALFRFAMSLARQQSAAEDLTQQTFLQWARKGSTLLDPSKAKTWLFTTLYREYLNQSRRTRRIEVVEFDSEIHGGDVPPDEPPRIERSALMSALEKLEPAYREPVILFYLKEISYKEIASVLSIPIGTVMSRLSRGKQMLRDLLRGAINPDDGDIISVERRIA